MIGCPWGLGTTCEALCTFMAIDRGATVALMENALVVVQLRGEVQEHVRWRRA